MYREGDRGHSPICNSLKESKPSRINPNQGREGPLGKPLKKERERYYNKYCENKHSTKVIYKFNAVPIKITEIEKIILKYT